MQAGGVVVAVQVVAAERELGEGVGAVDEDLDATLAGHRRDLADGQDLAGEVDDVGHLDHPRPRRHRGAEPLDDLVVGGARAAEGDRLDDDAVAAGALGPRGLGAAVILVGDHDLVAGLQVDAADQGLQALGGVAGDRHLLGVAAELAGQVAADALDAGLQDVPHLVGRGDVGEPQVADHRLQHGRRGRGHAAVVEVDQGAVGVEGAADLAPVGLIPRHVLGAELARSVARPEQAGCGVASPGRRRHGGRAGQETPSIAADQGNHLPPVDAGRVVPA